MTLGPRSSIAMWRARRLALRPALTSAIFLLALQSGPLKAASYTCLIEPSQVVNLAPRVGGILERVLVKRGDRVTRNQVVASLDSRAEQAAAAVARYRANMQGPSDLALDKIKFSQQTFERRRSMVAEKLMSQQESDNAEAEFKLAQAELKAAKEDREAARLEYAQQSTQIKLRTLRSPFDGVVVDQMIWPGEFVEPGGTKHAVLKLAKVDPLRVRVILPAKAFGSVAIGMPASVVPEISSGNAYTAKVSSVDRVIDAASSTFVVFLSLPNPRLDAPSGVRCKATFGLPKTK